MGKAITMKWPRWELCYISSGWVVRDRQTKRIFLVKNQLAGLTLIREIQIWGFTPELGFYETNQLRSST
jgi:hypothetical protein